MFLVGGQPLESPFADSFSCISGLPTEPLQAVGTLFSCRLTWYTSVVMYMAFCLRLVSRFHLESLVGCVQRSQMPQRAFSKKDLPKDRNSSEFQGWLTHSIPPEQQKVRRSPLPASLSQQAVPSLGEAHPGPGAVMTGEKLPHHTQPCLPWKVPDRLTHFQLPLFLSVWWPPPCFIHLASGSVQPHLWLCCLGLVNAPHPLTIGYL